LIAPIPDKISPSSPPRILLGIRVHAWWIFPVHRFLQKNRLPLFNHFQPSLLSSLP
jgi:hypothetical protein